MGIIARQAIWNTVFTYLGIGLGFVNVVLLYPKVLASDEFGLTRLLLSVAVITAQVAQFGAENTVVRYFPYFRDEQRQHRGMLSMIMLFGTAVGLLSITVLGLLHDTLSGVFADRNALYGSYGLFVLPLVLSEIYFLLLRSYSRSLRRTVQPTVIKEFQLRVMQTVLIAVQAWHPMPFGTFMALYCATFLSCTLILFLDLYRAGAIKWGWRHRWLPRRLRRSMMWYSGFTLSGTVAGIALGHLDQLMIGALLGDGLKQVAYYAVAFYFGSVIVTPARALNQVAVPLLADAWKRMDLGLIQDLYVRSSLLQTAISGYLLLLLWSGLDGLYTFLPPEYAAGAPVALVIGLGYFISSAIGLSIGIIAMSRSYRMDAWTSMLMLVISILGNYILIGRFGVIGAAYGTLLALVVINAYRTFFLWQRYGLQPFVLRTLGIVIALVGSGAVVELLPRLDAPLADAVLRCGTASVLFMLAVYRLHLFRDARSWLRKGAKNDR